MNKFFLSFCLLLLAILIIPAVAEARIGVGVGLGKIVADTSFKAGGVYNVATLPVINTGDEAADYEATIEFHENIPQLRPKREWFELVPKTFHLAPGQVQNVKVILTLPLQTQPGDYFNYIEGHPVNKAINNGDTSIGIAAAAKLYFTVTPANIFQGLYYRAMTIFNRYLPWSWVVVAVVVVATVITILRQFITIQIGVAKKK